MTALLTVDHVNKSFQGVRTLTDVTFDLEPGRILGLIGPNGAGKTTMFNVISGIYSADSGRVLLDGRDITNRSPARIAGYGVGRTFQVARTFNDMTVAENLRVALVNAGLSGREERRRITDMLDRVGLAGVRDLVVSALPDGQKKLLEAARAMMTSPRLLILDEPFGGVSAEVIDLLIHIIRDLVREGVGCLVISHDIVSLPRLCEEVLVLVEGKVMTRGAISEIRNDARIVDAYLGA
ncbi:branched-chain amino acid transport system ATP-binding protein [Angulomicrobium tetraedrale]|uniref:Branched-chain amino acid transport system ATP-binding protein n=1 Tax=Ancylobacter tetraedralis TaxID=217068 RepID=A0A839ZB19_9HYPH|nr:ABC transporter ATP-binding protein [Ancylobacter tetraedralis]MBB3771929.1 branched-chain amino acid transport system ATP-binding protein [Ancylobacter tetraedralis]